MISATGRTPVIAAPMAAPTIACSEMGVSQHPLGPELLEQAGRGLEHTAGSPDVLAQADHPRVAAHLAGDALGDGVAVGHHARGAGLPTSHAGSGVYVRHADPPSAHTSVNAWAGSAGGAAMAASTAAATAAAARSAAASMSAAGVPCTSRRRPGHEERVAGEPLLHLLGGPVGAGVGAAVPEVPVGQGLEHAGPRRRARARCTATDMASRTATTSLPSTSIAGHAVGGGTVGGWVGH